MNRRIPLLVVAILAAIGVASSVAQEARPPQPLYEYRTEHDPNGIGKFYMGREIAMVMGHQAADWLERPEREVEEQPERMLDTLKLKPGDSIADIGAGSGYITFRMVKRVGPKGLVYAVDIQPEMLQIIRNRMRQMRVRNVKPILGTIKDPRLPAESVDMILMVDVYHEFDHPYEMTRSMVRSLKPGGRIAFVEFKMEDPNVPIKLVHKMSEAQVRKEMSIHPVKWVETVRTLPWQHVVIFQRPGNIATPKVGVTRISPAAMRLAGSTSRSRGCNGADPCTACRNCNSCRHCSQRGGKCGKCS